MTKNAKQNPMTLQRAARDYMRAISKQDVKALCLAAMFLINETDDTAHEFRNTYLCRESSAIVDRIRRTNNFVDWFELESMALVRLEPWLSQITS
jgi:hypothetical protein